MTSFHVVTTMNAAGWEQTGRRMVDSFLAQWPESAKPLTVYAEGFVPLARPGMEVRQLPAWLEDFKRRHVAIAAHNGGRHGRYDYRFDGVKFAHKVAALTDFALGVEDGIVVWLDADTFTHAPVTEEWLDRLFPGSGYLAWLDRVNSHPECGMVMFRAGHPYHHAFMERFREIYTSDEVFRLGEFHDAYVLQHVVRLKMGAGKIASPVSLSGDPRWHHPFVNGPLGERLDHLKGPRKGEGRSRRRDTRVPRSEPYWREVQ